MATIRAARAQPFTAARSALPRPCLSSRVVVARPTRSIVARAAELTINDFGEDVDVSGASSATVPIASEDVRLRVRMRGYDISLLADAINQVQAIAGVTGAEFKGPVMLPTRKRVYCVLRSPHVNKDAREHFEVRTHHRLVDLKNLSAQTVEAMMQWIPPSGVEVEASIV